jgi:hypothetical protein
MDSQGLNFHDEKEYYKERAGRSAAKDAKEHEQKLDCKSQVFHNSPDFHMAQSALIRGYFPSQ